MFDAAAVPSTIVLRERHTGGTRTVLEIEHDGSDPPEALLAELREIWWLGAVSIPPPASAIDWSTPDPVTGQRFSIRRHRAVVHATLEGSTEARLLAVERSFAAAARHHPVEPGDPAAGAGPATALYDVVCTAANAPNVRATAAAIGTVLDDRAEQEVVTVRFRTSTTERIQELRRLRLAVRGMAIDEVRQAFAGAGVRTLEPSLDGAGQGAVTGPVAVARRTVPEAATRAPVPLADGAPTYELVCTAENAPAVRAAVAAVGTVLHERSEWETVTVRFRGNSAERDRELRRILLAVDRGGVDDLRAALVGTGVRSLERSS